MKKQWFMGLFWKTYSKKIYSKKTYLMGKSMVSGVSGFDFPDETNPLVQPTRMDELWINHGMNNG
jgi:hypothetical protein